MHYLHKLHKVLTSKTTLVNITWPQSGYAGIKPSRNDSTVKPALIVDKIKVSTKFWIWINTVQEPSTTIYAQG